MLVKEQKISSFILYSLLIVTAILMGLFYLGGVVPETASSEFPEPVFTEWLIYWIYVLLGLGILSTVGFGIYHFFKFFRNNPRQAIKSMSGVILLSFILFLSWKLGSGTALDIPNYTGNSNTYFWLKVADMFLFAFYFLLGTTLCAIVCFRVYYGVRQ